MTAETMTETSAVPETPALTETTVARALNQARRMTGLTIDDVTDRTGIPAAALRAIELDQAVAARGTLTMLSALYGLDADRLGSGRWVERHPPALGPEGDGSLVLWIDWFPVRFSDGASNLELMTMAADGVRLLRNIGPTQPVRMRRPELDLLVSMLDLRDPDLVMDAMRAFRMPRNEANETISASMARVRGPRLVRNVRTLMAQRSA